MRNTSPQPLSKGEGLNSPIIANPSLNKKGINICRRAFGKQYFYIIAVIIISIVTSCGSSQRPSAPSEVQAATPVPVARLTVPKDTVLTLQIPSDAGQTYSIYYPSTAKKPETTPVLICFDPHGGGRIPIDKYRKWADKYGVAIAGSNSSRNGLSAADGTNIAGNMIIDINKRLGFDNRRMTLCGFSGGAKVAISAINDLSNSIDIYDLIYAGAVTQLKSNNPPDILGFAGTQDMNYTDLLQFNESLPATNPNHALIEYNGKHEWPDAATFEMAFYWVIFQPWRQNVSPRDNSIIKTFIKKSNKAIADAEAKSDWVNAYQESKIAYTFLNSGIADVTFYEKKMETIAKSDIYIKQLAQKNEMLSKEANEKQMLLQAFQNQNLDWWGKVIHGYQSSSNPSDKRLLGFISLASFSYSNQLLQQQNLEGAEKILSIYELCDPDNTDQLYFHAILYADKNNTPLALKYLQKAVANGLKDVQKIEAEQAFIPLRNDPGFSQVVAALKKASK